MLIPHTPAAIATMIFFMFQMAKLAVPVSLIRGDNWVREQDVHAEHD